MIKSLIAVLSIVCALALLGQHALARKDYVERTVTDEHRFLQIIGQYNTAWVKYTFGGEKQSDKDLGRRFWKVLKSEFGNQVEAFIVVDTTGWSKSADSQVFREIGKNKFPSFVLYQRGKVVNDGTPNDIRLQGPPSGQKNTKLYLDYGKTHSFLH